MNLFGFLKARGSAPVARERLQILLAHERVALGPRDLVAILRDELLATIARHIEFDPEKLSVKMERSDSVSTLEIDVEIPCDKFVARPQAPFQALFARRAPLSLGDLAGSAPASMPAMNSRMRGTISLRNREPLKTP
jgi:cell division topological specificity factor